MFKKIIASIAAIATLATPVAMAQSVGTDAAYISADAKLVKQENEGAYIEYEYRDEAANAEIEALADASGKYVIVKTEYEVKRKKLTATLDRDAAIKAAQAMLPGCEVDYIYFDEDDGVNEWHAFCTLDGDMYMMEFAAESAQLIRLLKQEVIPGAADAQSESKLLTAREAVDALKLAKGDLDITDLDFDFDDDAGIMYYEGECTLDGKKYEFKINAYDGSIAEWELDD